MHLLSKAVTFRVDVASTVTFCGSHLIRNLNRNRTWNQLTPNFLFLFFPLNVLCIYLYLASVNQALARALASFWIKIDFTFL